MLPTMIQSSIEMERMLGGSWVDGFSGQRTYNTRLLQLLPTGLLGLPKLLLLVCPITTKNMLKAHIESAGLEGEPRRSEKAHLAKARHPVTSPPHSLSLLQVVQLNSHTRLERDGTIIAKPFLSTRYEMSPLTIMGYAAIAGMAEDLQCGCPLQSNALYLAAAACGAVNFGIQSRL